jgi:hypothetical protein
VRLGFGGVALRRVFNIAGDIPQLVAEVAVIDDFRDAQPLVLAGVYP